MSSLFVFGQMPVRLFRVCLNFFLEYTDIITDISYNFYRCKVKNYEFFVAFFLYTLPYKIILFLSLLCRVYNYPDFKPWKVIQRAVRPVLCRFKARKDKTKPAGFLPHRLYFGCYLFVSRSRIGLRYWPVYDCGQAATSSGVPQATTVPPRSPPSGPRSMI